MDIFLLFGVKVVDFCGLVFLVRAFGVKNLVDCASGAKVIGFVHKLHGLFAKGFGLLLGVVVGDIYLVHLGFAYAAIDAWLFGIAANTYDVVAYTAVISVAPDRKVKLHKYNPPIRYLL